MGIRKNIKNARTNSDLVTLVRLLNLKKNREQTLRRCISGSIKTQENLKRQTEGCRIKREQICEQLKELTHWQGVLEANEFAEHKELFHSFYEQEREQLSKRNEFLMQLKQIGKKLQELQLLLKLNLIKQEKLRILIKDESNSY
ncbi:type III secretion system apparatus protein [Candidatus Hamiltonella defensa]|uniref:type III secretion system apparatus protein n=1 Tax=Candidatus Williamhamiltonella defendens TaxID=138072 RepID=UPI000C1EA46D|nr:type III secretion system apparatus protein [Candidatus Hamiltonella defensa]AWK15834.1 type III secretion system apparatus protein [Candidatus Hamiltonella defensa]MBK4362039.1 type III secretion system apparatus protein [Candidatus Hamiltonella defensa]